MIPSNFTREVHQNVIVENVELSRATLKEAREFKSFLDADIEKGFKYFVVDIRECEFMDSTFLSTLVTTLKFLSGRGGNLKLSSVTSDVQNILELTGTYKVFEIFDSKKEAINSYKSLV